MLQHLQRLLLRDLNSVIEELEMFPDESTIWLKPPGIANSAGNLALHLCGNLKHYIGAVLGDTGYVRDRAAEFNMSGVGRKDLIKNIRETMDMLSTVMPRLSDAQLDAIYPQEVGGVQPVTRLFLLHLSTHLAFHLGQLGYLRRILTRENRSANPVSVRRLA